MKNVNELLQIAQFLRSELQTAAYPKTTILRIEQVITSIIERKVDEQKAKSHSDAEHIDIDFLLADE